MTYNEVKAVMMEKGYRFFMNINSINIIGVRNNTSDNKFGGHIYVLWIDGMGRERILDLAATTKPGTHWLLNPLNLRGTAIMKEGQYLGAYKLGIHNRSRPSKSYEALEQVKSIDYYRDNTKDSKHDIGGKVYKDIIKMNIHRASKSGWSKFVDKWSAGCQVITGLTSKDKTNWEDFIDLVKLSKDAYGNSFSYTLLNERDFE
jgi:hypothetical protein